MIKLIIPKLSLPKVCLGLLYLLRIILCIIPQHGYIHPDEFFQFTEPMAIKSANIKGHLTWEWSQKDTHIRSVFFPHLLASSVFNFIKYYFGSNSICSYVLLVLPRLLFVFMSFGLDVLLYKCCLLTKTSRIKEILMIFASSYVTFTYFTHTFTNTIEAWLFATLIFMIFKNLKSKEENYSVLIAFVLVLGIWNRPTFIFYSCYPVLYWVSLKNHQSRKFSNNFKLMLKRFAQIALISFLFSFIFVFMDTLFYNSNFIMELFINKNFAKFDFKEFVVTPLNFIKFNMKNENLEIFGLNPLYLHLVVNMYLLFSNLSCFLFLDVFYYMKNALYDIQKIKNNVLFKTNFRSFLITSVVVPLLILSLVPHQEPRFLIPLLLPLAFLYALEITKKKYLVCVWIIFNILLTCFYGYVHQAGVTKSIFSIKTELLKTNSNIANVVFSSTYLPPQHLFGFTNENLKKVSSKVIIHDLSVSQFPESLIKTLTNIQNSSKKNQITYLVIPSTLNTELIKINSSLNLNMNLFKQIFPTFNHEYFKIPVSFGWNELKDKFSTNIWLIKHL